MEEMNHADKLVVRIVFHDGMPKHASPRSAPHRPDRERGARLRPATGNVGRALYQEAATYCHSVKDYVSRDLFEKLMHDEEQHIEFLETQLDLVAKLGLELYAQHHMGKTDDHAD